MNDRPTTPDEDAGQPDPTVTFALRAMAPPEHGDAFWERLDATLRAETVAPTTAVPLVAPAPPPPPPVPPPPPLAEVVPLPAPRRSRPAAPWIAAAAAAVLVVALAAGALVRTSGTDVESTPAATGIPVEPSTTALPPTLAPPATGPIVAPSSTARQAPSTTAAPRTTTTARPVSLALSPEGLGPLRLGMTTRQARATGAAGAYSEPLGPGCGFAGPAGPYRAGDFEALFLEDKLVRFYIGDKSRLRTPQGIGVGSAKSSLSAVPGSRVERPHPYSDPSDPSPMIDVEIMTGGVGYLFSVQDGIVTEWSVGTKNGLDTIEGCA